MRHNFLTKERGWRACLRLQWLILAIVGVCLACFQASSFQTKAWGQSPGEITIDLLDPMSTPLQCRVRVLGPNGNILKVKSVDVVQGWSLVEGKLFFRGRAGDYRYEIYHGPEFAPVRGHFVLDKRSEAFDEVTLPRHADLASERWLAGDLLSYLPAQRTQRWLAAEGLFYAGSIAERSAEVPVDVANLPSQSENAAPQDDYSGWMDSRAGSGLVIHHWPNRSSAEDVSKQQLPRTLGTPPDAWLADDKSPSSRWIVQAKSQSAEDQSLPVHVEIQKLWARDLPIWLASGRVDSVQLLSEHLTIDGQTAVEVQPLLMPEGKYEGGRAAGRIVEQIYFHMLEAGLRIPLTAGSGFGRRGSPLGYNRVYALTGSPSQQGWWRALRAGNSFVTNGPLMRVQINEMPPGHLFQSPEPIELDIGLVLTTSDPVDYVEVLHNGTSLYRAALDEHAKQGGKIPLLKVSQSGWLMVRVVTGRDFTYRLATTSPFYFEIADQQRISRRSVEYFQRWLALARQQIAQLPQDQQDLHEPYLRSAEKFWQARLQLSQ